VWAHEAEGISKVVCCEAQRSTARWKRDLLWSALFMLQEPQRLVCAAWHVATYLMVSSAASCIACRFMCVLHGMSLHVCGAWHVATYYMLTTHTYHMLTTDHLQTISLLYLSASFRKRSTTTYHLFLKKQTLEYSGLFAQREVCDWWWLVL